jgi:NADPH-dependent 2,4-dienoyl-CoA reductase/sulfur reductase-like enzyme
VCGRTLIESGPRGAYIFVPPNGRTPDRSYLPLLIPIALVVGGGIAALEAAVVARLARRRSG